jgi:hypothetical protein
MSERELRDELVTALGAPVEELDHARDPRVVVPSALRTARFVLDGDKVAAIVLVQPPPAVAADAGAAQPPLQQQRDDCPRPASTDKAIGACLTGAGELVEVVDGSEIILRAPESEKALAALRVPNTVFAAPLRVGDGRDELMVITRSTEPDLRSWSLVGFRFDNGKITRSIEPTLLYQVSSSSARWIGAEVRDVELYLRLAAKGDLIEAGGLLTTRPSGGPIRDVVLLSAVSVARKHAPAPREPSVGAGSDRAKP